jgi:hypothetical protein
VAGLHTGPGDAVLRTLCRTLYPFRPVRTKKGFRNHVKSHLSLISSTFKD